MVARHRPPSKNNENFEKAITIRHVLFVFSYIATEIIETRLTFLRLNPPRLLISQFLQYVSMLLAAFFVRMFGRKKNMISHKKHLSLINSATLTLLDISCDASLKIAMSLAPEKSETLFFLFPIFQSIFSLIFFNQKLTFIEFIGLIFQTIGYISISSSPVGEPFEPIYSTPYFVFGIESVHAGYLFLILSILLNCISMTIVQSLSTTISLSPLSFCAENGVWGIVITSLYHSYISFTKKEKIFISPTHNSIILITAFVAASALRHYMQFWLILHTSAVELSRIIIFATMLNFFVRHSVFREEVLTFGYSSIPYLGVVFSFLGFNLSGFSVEKRTLTEEIEQYQFLDSEEEEGTGNELF